MCCAEFAIPILAIDHLVCHVILVSTAVYVRNLAPLAHFAKVRSMKVIWTKDGERVLVFVNSKKMSAL